MTYSLSLATFCRPNSLFSSASRAHSVTGGVTMNRRQFVMVQASLPGLPMKRRTC